MLYLGLDLAVAEPVATAQCVGLPTLILRSLAARLAEFAVSATGPAAEVRIHDVQATGLRDVIQAAPLGLSITDTRQPGQCLGPVPLRVALPPGIQLGHRLGGPVAEPAIESLAPQPVLACLTGRGRDPVFTANEAAAY
jgi:hypothetical protein